MIVYTGSKNEQRLLSRQAPVTADVAHNAWHVGQVLNLPLYIWMPLKT